MISVLFTVLALAVVGVVGPLVAMMSETTYGSSLEQYIASRNPKDTADVERYTRDYESKKNFI
jgi:hypothetical protein